MRYRRVGKSGLKVSEIGLGSYNFGGRVNEADSIKIINQALDLGINFIDTAPSYGHDVTNSYGHGKSEEAIGKAIKGKRSNVILATKFGAFSLDRPDRQRGSRLNIMDLIDASLKRLNTDYIDVYYAHHPDPETPIQETLRAMDDLVRTGKVRYIGCSTFNSWQLCEALWTSKAYNLESFILAGEVYNLLNRSIEKELVPCCEAYGVGFVPTEPLAAGFLTGKYERGKKMPAGARLAAHSSRDSLLTNENFDKLDMLKAFAQARGHSVADLAIAWLLSRPWLGSVIAGASNVDQLSANAAAADWKLSAEEIAEIDKMVQCGK